MLPSYFWLARRPRAITASAACRGTVTAQARPCNTRGGRDGGEKVTRKSDADGGPAPWNIVTCTSARPLSPTVEVIWEARWRIGGGTWRPSVIHHIDSLATGCGR